MPSPTEPRRSSSTTKSPPPNSQQTQSLTKREQALNQLLRWKHDPVKFVTEAFSMPLSDIEPWQVGALQSITTYDKISIKSGHGVGKSTYLSWVLLWWLSTRYPARVGCTAPTSHQLFDVLWSEVAIWLRRMTPPLARQFIMLSDRISLDGGKTETFAVARTSRKETPDALQGLHSPNMLFLIDEASGVDEAIFEAAKGALTTLGAKEVLTGNPLRASGYFWRSHQPDSPFHRITVSCLDSRLVSPLFIEDMRAAYGENSNAFRVRVLGEFPTSDDDTFIPLDIVESAMGRDIAEPPYPMSSEVWGLDVARFGSDASVLTRRRGAYVYDQMRWRNIDLMELTGAVKNYWDLTKPHLRPERIYIDTIGLGSGVHDRLNELNLPVVGVNVSEVPPLEGPYHRMRDELWGRTKRWLETKTARLPINPLLATELTTPRVSYMSSGKMRIETKDKLRSRGFRSPDFADSLTLTFTGETAIAAGLTSSPSSNWNKPHKQPNRSWVI